MIMLKKTAAIGLAISMIFSAVSCGTVNSPQAIPEASSVSVAEESFAGDTSIADISDSVTAESDSFVADLSDASNTESSLSADAETAAPDYSNPENWAYSGIGEDKDADLFLICPTVDMNEEKNMSLLDEKMKSRFLGALNMQSGIYSDSSRMYAPYYRQASMYVYQLDEDEREEALALAYSDISAAFAFYIENENGNRPIILAGFSQGADMCLRLLKEYFGDEELYDRLIAVYAIGSACTEELVNEYPQIKPARSADDTGVVISFDCEAPDVKETLINPAGQKAYTINPLNWKTDGTVADKSENLGACFPNYSGEITSEQPRLCGCYIDEERGVLKVTDINKIDYPAAISVLPEGSFHIYDYQFFYRNLQENVAERVSAYAEADAEEQAA